MTSKFGRSGLSFVAMSRQCSPSNGQYQIPVEEREMGSQVAERLIQSHVFLQETIHIILSSYNTHCASSTLYDLNVSLKKYERIIDALEKDISSVDSETIDEWEKDVEAKKNGLNTALANFKKDTSKIVKNVNKNSLALTRSKQNEVKNYKRKK